MVLQGARLVVPVRSDSGVVSEAALVLRSMLDSGRITFILPFDLPGRERATFRCMILLFASDGVNSAASIASRTVSVGARFRTLAALATLSASDEPIPDMMGK